MRDYTLTLTADQARSLMSIANIYKLPSMELVTNFNQLDDSSVYGMNIGMVNNVSHNCEVFYNYVDKNPDKQFFEVWDV